MSAATQREPIWRWLKQTALSGGPGQTIFAINNACNAGCDFCNFALDSLPRDQWEFVSKDGATDAIDILHKLFIRYLIVTGGEPMLHRELLEIVEHANRRGMTVLLVTNGSRLNRERCRELKEAGVSSVIISIDAPTAEAHEKNRGLPKVCERIREANVQFSELGMQTTASVTVSRLVGDYGRLVEFLKVLGFRCVTFSYPLTALPSSFLGYKASPAGRVQRSRS